MNRLRVFVVLFVAAFAAADEMIPFVIPVDIHPDSEIAMSYKPLTETDRLTATRYFRTAKGHRVRLWGVNLSFSANFPTHEDAARIAKRMAAFGVNSVRFHHMDTAHWPRGIWDKSGRDLHPEALDRLDYFIDQLAARGIYSNINLHVGAEHSKTLGLPEATRNYDKVITLFTPKLIDAQKDYAHKLLTHKNKYRDNVTYTDDYAVAIVEITNENSFFMWDGETTLRNLPPYYAKILQTQYNLWLKNKYTTTEQLKQAWSKDVEPMGDKNLLQSAVPETGWYLEQHGKAKAKIPTQVRDEFLSLNIDIETIDGTGWHLQYNHRNLPFEQGRYYTVTFKARAAAERNLSVSVGQAHEPWANLGLSRTVKLTPQWQTFTLGFAAAQSDDNGRLNFAFGDSNVDIELGTAQLHTGGQMVLGPDESIEQANVALFADREAKARVTDRMVFLAEMEKAYFDNMRQYIKNDLGCKAMITGTIVFGPLGLYAQSDMDFIDGHAYWQHPHFPNKPWDAGDWTINQKAMTDFPDEATLYQLATQRLAGKPYTVTEYNHPAPLDAQAECVPMIASFAAAQNWDGVWLYTYSHSNEHWDREHLNSYFDIDTNPAKWGFMNTGAALFRDEILQPLHQFYSGLPLPSKQNQLWLQGLAQDHLSLGSNMLKVIGPNMNHNRVRQSGRLTAKANLEWDNIDHQGLYVVRNDRCCIITGHTERFSIIKSPVSLRIDSPGFAAITIIALDDKTLSYESGKILITACGRCENTEMKFSKDRRTVGRNWGNAPVRIEPVEGQIILTSQIGNAPLICKILNPDGTIKQQFPIKNGIVPLKAKFGTMWYLIERK